MGKQLNAGDDVIDDYLGKAVIIKVVDREKNLFLIKCELKPPKSYNKDGNKECLRYEKNLTKI